MPTRPACPCGAKRAWAWSGTGPPAAPGSDRAEARLYARTELKLKFVGETDGGLRFGAELDLDKLGSDTSNPRRGQSVFIGN